MDCTELLLMELELIKLSYIKVLCIHARFITHEKLRLVYRSNLRKSPITLTNTFFTHRLYNSLLLPPLPPSAPSSPPSLRPSIRRDDKMVTYFPIPEGRRCMPRSDRSFCSKRVTWTCTATDSRHTNSRTSMARRSLSTSLLREVRKVRIISSNLMSK